MGNNILTYRVFNQSKEELIVYTEKTNLLSPNKNLTFKSKPSLLKENDRVMFLYQSKETEVCIIIKDLTISNDKPAEKMESYGNEIQNHSSRSLIVAADKYKYRVNKYNVILPSTLLLKPGEKTSFLASWVIKNVSEELSIKSKKDKNFTYIVRDNKRLYAFIENFSSTTLMVMSKDKVLTVEPREVSVIKNVTEIYSDYQPLNYHQSKLPSRSYVGQTSFSWKQDKTNCVLLRVE
jgi:hypothetical protein